MILFFHETKHIGGGQSFVEAYKKILKQSCLKFDFLENKIDKKTIKKILAKKYKKAFIHLYSPRFIPLLLLLKLMNIHVVITVYGLWFLESKSQRPNISRIETLLLYIKQGLILYLCDKLIAFSKYEKEILEQNFLFVKRKISLIPGGIDEKSFYPVSLIKKQKIREKLHLSKKSTIFLILSRLERRKGIHLAIQAFGNIIKSHPDSLLCIVFPIGQYSYPEMLVEYFSQVSKLDIGQHVHFITGVNAKNIPLYFQASDFFLMSSAELETFGLSTIEAAASGCVPIGFKSGATTELLYKINKDLLVTPISSESLAKKINWILSLTTLQKQKLRYQSIEMSNFYKWNKISKSLVELL